jgi:hypothetical protein
VVGWLEERHELWVVGRCHEGGVMDWPVKGKGLNTLGFHLFGLVCIDFGPREVECLCGFSGIFYSWVNGYGDC